MKYLLLIIYIIINFVSFASADDKIVFLNVNYIFSNSTTGKNANETIKKKIIKLENDVKNFSSEINKDKEELAKQKNIITENDFKNKLVNIENKVKEFNKKIKIRNNEIAELKKKVRLNFVEQLREILSEYSEKNSIKLIIKQENVLIGSNKLNISDEILEIVNKKKIKLIN